MINIFEELSWILVAAEISSSQEEQILTVVKNLSASPEVIKELEFHEEPKASTDHLCQSMEETKDSWTIYTGEKFLEPKTEERSTFLSTNLVCIPETNHPQEDNQVKESLSSSSTLCITSFAAVGYSYFNVH